MLHKSLVFLLLLATGIYTHAASHSTPTLITRTIRVRNYTDYVIKLANQHEIETGDNYNYIKLSFVEGKAQTIAWSVSHHTTGSQEQRTVRRQHAQIAHTPGDAIARGADDQLHEHVSSSHTHTQSGIIMLNAHEARHLTEITFNQDKPRSTPDSPCTVLNPHIIEPIICSKKISWWGRLKRNVYISASHFVYGLTFNTAPVVPEKTPLTHEELGENATYVGNVVSVVAIGMLLLWIRAKTSAAPQTTTS